MKLRALLALSALAPTVAFSGPRLPLRTAALRGKSSLNLKMFAGPLDAFREPLLEYGNSWKPLFDSFGWSEPVLHWLHPVNMAVVLFTMCVQGTFLGWRIRTQPDNKLIDRVTGKTDRELHPLLMGGATFFFLVGGNGGLTLNVVLGNDPIASPHAYTGFIGLSLLFIQAGLTLFFDGNPAARTAHAYLGTATMVLLVIHFVFGVQYGLSF